MIDGNEKLDILMLGTFSAWQRGTIQSRALPFAIELQRSGFRVAILTTSWDMSRDNAVIDSVDGLPIIHTRYGRASTLPQILMELHTWVRRLNPSALHLVKPRGSSGLYSTLQALAFPEMRLTTVDLDDWEGDGGWNDSGQYGFLQKRIFDWQEWRLPRGADHIFAASHLLYQREVRRHGHRRPPISFVPNGLTRSWFEALRKARSERKATDTPRVVLYSRFAEFPDNWLEHFVCELQRSTTCPVVIEIIGDTGHSARVLTPSNKIGINIHGYVARQRIPELLAAADIAIYPYEDSLISRSKQSVKLLELMAAGCPVIASDVGEVPGIVAGAGVLLNDSSPEFFARAVNRTLQNRDRLESLSSAAIERVENNFMIPKLAEGIGTTYRNLGVGPAK